MYDTSIPDEIKNASVSKSDSLFDILANKSNYNFTATRSGVDVKTYNHLYH